MTMRRSKRHEMTKGFLDKAVDKAYEDGDYAKGPSVFGTRVHKRL
jgi:hypothetical protein